MKRFLFLLFFIPFICSADECDPPTVIRPTVAMTEAHGFLSLTSEQIVSNNAAIIFSGPSVVGGGMTTSGGTSLVVPRSGNYLILFSVVQTGETISNFGIFINGSALLGGTMDNGRDSAGVISNNPYLISRITSLSSGESIDIRNITGGGSATLTATDSSAGASTRASLTVVALS